MQTGALEAFGCFSQGNQSFMAAESNEQHRYLDLVESNLTFDWPGTDPVVKDFSKIPLRLGVVSATSRHCQPQFRPLLLSLPLASFTVTVKCTFATAIAVIMVLILATV